MPETLSTDKLLSHPDVMRVIDKRNPEFFERTAYRPPACEVFKAPATELLDEVLAVGDAEFQEDQDDEEGS